MNIPELLYHYCSSDAFYGIITSKSLWLSNAKYSNDPQETLILKKVIERLSKEDKNDTLSSFAKRLLDSWHEVVNNPLICVFCMTEKSENLNQWRLYGDKGYGYMIALRTNFFLNSKYWYPLNYEELPMPNFETLYLAKCIYSKDTQYRLVRKLLSNAILWLSRNKEQLEITKHYLQIYSAIFKAPAYEDEDEWRLFMFPVVQQKHNKFRYPIKYRNKRGLYIQYVEHNFVESASFENPSLNLIEIGSNVINSEFEIMNFVKDIGFYYQKLKRSELKMRDL